MEYVVLRGLGLAHGTWTLESFQHEGERVFRVEAETPHAAVEKIIEINEPPTHRAETLNYLAIPVAVFDYGRVAVGVRRFFYVREPRGSNMTHYAVPTKEQMAAKEVYLHADVDLSEEARGMLCDRARADGLEVSYIFSERKGGSRVVYLVPAELDRPDQRALAAAEAVLSGPGPNWTLA